MATERQRAAARKNIKKAAAAAKKKKTIANLPSRVRTALGKKGAVARKKRSK
jgi:hypothetical protein